MGHEYLQHLLQLRGYPNRYASDFSATVSITAVGDLLAPATPSSLSASNQLEEIHVSWTNPTTNADGSACNDFKWAKVYYKSTTGVTTSSYDGTYLTSAESWVDEQAVGTTRYYIITALDATGNESAASSEVNGTSLSVTASTSVPADASNLVFDDNFGTDGVVTGDSMLGIVFKNPASTWVNFDRYRLWYQYTDDGGTTWKDKDGVADQWTEIERVKRTGYIHKGLTSTYGYRYKGTVVGANDSESTTADTAGGAATTPNGANNDLIVATLVLAEFLTATNEVRGPHISATSTICINDRTFGNQGVQLDYNSGTPRAYIGDGANAFWQFDGTKITWKAANTELDGSGNLIATSVTLTGAITATSGTIGGFTCDATNGLYSGAAGTRIQMKAGTGFWLGATAYAGAPFRVSPAGAVVATSATITGAITATSGTIGGFTCDATEGLYAGAAATRIQMKVGTGLWLGATTYAAAPFKVSPAGAVVATSFTTITPSGGASIISSGIFQGTWTYIKSVTDDNVNSLLSLTADTLGTWDRLMIMYEVHNQEAWDEPVYLRLNNVALQNYVWMARDGVKSGIGDENQFYIAKVDSQRDCAGTIYIESNHQVTEAPAPSPSAWWNGGGVQEWNSGGGWYKADIYPITRVDVFGLLAADHMTGYIACYGMNYP